MDLNSNIKDKKYLSLYEKINSLQNLSMNNQNNISSLEYNINKLDNDANNSISNFTKKIECLEKSMESMLSMNDVRQEIYDNNQKKFEKELNVITLEIKNKIENHKNVMTQKIDNDFGQIQNQLNIIYQEKKQQSYEIYQKIEKLKNIAKNDIPNLIYESQGLNLKNKNNNDLLINMINEEVNYTKSIIFDNSQKIDENEKKFSKDFRSVINNINENLNNIKKLRKKHEEDMFTYLTDFIKKIKISVG